MRNSPILASKPAATTTFNQPVTAQPVSASANKQAAGSASASTSAAAAPQTSKPTSPTAAGAPHSHAPAHVAQPQASQQQVRVFGSNEDQTPIALFEAGVPAALVLSTLRVHGGGLKVKGADDVFAHIENCAAGDYVVFGGAPLKLKVTLNGNRLLIPYTHRANKIHQLMDEIAIRFARFNNTPAEPIKIAELQTSDGFALGKYDKVQDVLDDGYGVLAIDYKLWMKEQSNLCKEDWLRLERVDVIDNAAKLIRVGKQAYGKLFIQVWIGKEMKRLEIFEVEELQEYAKDGTQPVLTMKGAKDKMEWTVGVSFVVSGGVVTGVQAEVKACADERAEIKELVVTIDNGVLDKGEIKNIQKAEIEVPEYTDHVLPGETHTGPTFDAGTPQEPFSLPKTDLLALKVETAAPTDAESEWARDGAFWTYFYHNFTFTNPHAENEVAIAKVTSQYFKDGAWVDIKETRLGYKQGFFNYNMDWNNKDCYFALGPQDKANVAISTSIQLKAPQFEKLRRAHSLFPSPLKFKFTFEDVQGKIETLETEYRNPPADLRTKASLEKSNNKPYAFFLHCDDAAANHRHYYAIARVKENDGSEYLEFKTSLSSTSYSFSRPRFQKIGMDAAAAGKEVFELTDLGSEDKAKDSKLTVSALVDLPTKRVYGIKVEIKSNENTAEGYFKVPMLAVKA